MIVQTAAEGAPYFVMEIDRAWGLCRAHGPCLWQRGLSAGRAAEVMLYLIDNHDRGRAGFDERPGRASKRS